MTERSLTLLLLLFFFSQAQGADDEMLERGQYLIHAGGCITCHTADADDAVPLAGGRALVTPFGTFYSPNITPDKDTGIGNWSDEDFVAALQNGVNPDGDHYYPSFPYPSYTGALREDLVAMKVWLFSIDAERQENLEHELPIFMSSRLAAGAWKSRYFESVRFEPDPERSDQWNRGAYLVRHLGHCGECHSPRGRFGVIKEGQELTGNPDGPEGEEVPGLHNDNENGLGKWSIDDIEYFLEIGMLPDGDFASSSMVAVIDDNTSQLTSEDRKAIAVYLKSAPIIQ